MEARDKGEVQVKNVLSMITLLTVGAECLVREKGMVSSSIGAS